MINPIVTECVWFENGCFINQMFNTVCNVRFWTVKFPSGISLDFNRRAYAFRAAFKY